MNEFIYKRISIIFLLSLFGVTASCSYVMHSQLIQKYSNICLENNMAYGHLSFSGGDYDVCVKDNTFTLLKNVSKEN